MRMSRWSRSIKALLTTLAFAMMLAPFSAGAAEHVMKVGVMGPMKFVYGDHMYKGAKLAAQEINAGEGVRIDGKKYEIEIIKADSNCFLSVPDAISAMERLVSLKKVDFVSGGYRTETSLAQQEIMADNKTIFISGGAAHDELTERIAEDYDRYKYYFRNWICSSQQSLMFLAQTLPVIRTLRQELGVETPKVAILMDKAKWTDPITEAAHRIFPLLGCEISGEWRHSFSATDLSSELSAIKSAGSHMIFQMNAGPAGRVLAKQWGELKIPAALVGGSVEGGDPKLWESTGGQCRYAASSGYMRIAMTEKSIPFWDKFVKEYGETPIYQAPLAYDHIYVLKKAVEKAGTLEDEAVIPELEKLRHVGTFGTIDFNPPSHERPHDQEWAPSYTSTGGQWLDGEQKCYWPDGHKMHPELVKLGAATGWEGVRFPGTVDYQLPPWVVEYWKGE